MTMGTFHPRTPGRATPRQRESHIWLVGCALAILLAAWLTPTPRAEFQRAYLDPGSGSLIIQAVIAAVAGAAVLLRTYWDKVKSFLGLSRDEDREED